MLPTNSYFSVGLEQGRDDSFRAHSLSLLGLEVIAESAEAAAERFSRQLRLAFDEMKRLGLATPPPESTLEIGVDEWIRTDAHVGKGESMACFDADRAPLTDADLSIALDRLGSLRGRIVGPLRRSRNETIESIPSGDSNLRVLLDELASRQWWTLSRLGASSLAEVPDQVIARLDTSMALIIHRLTRLTDDERAQSLVIERREWTPRLVVRHLLWLEWTLGSAAVNSLSSTAGAHS